MNDPLAQLQDIQLPEQIHQYPIAPGWWLLLALILITSYLLFRYYTKQKQLKRAQRQALILTEQSLEPSEIIALFKRTALAYWPRTDIAALYGQNLQQFLANQLTSKYQEQFNQLSADSFTLSYQASSTVPDNKQKTNSNQEFQQALTLWLKHALPPKANRPNSKEVK